MHNLVREEDFFHNRLHLDSCEYGEARGEIHQSLLRRLRVANWPNFRPHNSKGAVKKYVRPKTLAAEFLSNVRQKGPKTFFSSFF
jgi:hypothetical protein